MKKIKLIFILLAVSFAFTACAGGKKEQKEDIPEVPSEAEIDVEEEEPDYDEIDQDTSDKILEEKLKGTECRAIFSEYSEVDGIACYLYSVVDKDQNELDQMLAVNAVSEEVMVYDGENDKLLNYDRFQYYKDDGKSPASWDSTYYLAPRTVKLMPADDNSFEFTITKDEEKEPRLQGMAYVTEGDIHQAKYEDEKVSLTFVNNGETLEIRDNGNISGVAGIYERQD